MGKTNSPKSNLPTSDELQVRGFLLLDLPELEKRLAWYSKCASQPGVARHIKNIAAKNASQIKQAIERKQRSV